MWEILDIQRHDEIRLAFFRASAERIVLGVGRNSWAASRPDLFSALANQIHGSSNSIWADTKSPQHFFILVQNLFRHEPDETALLRPLVEYIGARISTRRIQFAES